MFDLSPLDVAGLAGLAAGLSVLVLWLLAQTLPKERAGFAASYRQPGTTFLFCDEALVDHDAATLDLPASRAPDESDWSRFCRWMAFRFGALPPDPSGLLDGDPLSFHENVPGEARLTLLRSCGTLRVTLQDGVVPDCAARHGAQYIHNELQARSTALQHAPVAVWSLDAQRQTIWENEAACALPPAHAAALQNVDGQPGNTDRPVATRLSVPKQGGMAERWYDVHVTETEGETLLFAQDVTGLVRAETSQRDFVQTLSRTFADLTTGLVVFDRAETLAVFNPALADLTGLPPAFLSARPGLFAFFDALRDRMVMPEPKNYATWRGQILDMVKSATGGLYHEVWSLPAGQTYRVTGRPHPDGAVAFLFEDISGEVSATRRHRIQMGLRQAVLDRLDEGIAVLSQNGRLLFCNSGFGRMLGIDPDTSFAGMGLHDVIAACNARYPDPALWPEITEKIETRALHATLRDRVGPRGQDGADLRVVPLGRGQSMICLRSVDPVRGDKVGQDAH
ncbi:PAS-domain containing protein [uncultured Roseovarius sp.]|uniref:PAS-domain containing protein n=1 Tax=uncultured Roseovarius sp. TaxID=293344 RepID=UPI00262588A7|nr:PAS-domain containing protein [uncultured Roseovarius sp.]